MTAPRREPFGHLSGTWAKMAEVVSPRSWVTVSGSSHASFIAAYEAVCVAFLGVAWKDETYFLMLGHS